MNRELIPKYTLRSESYIDFHGLRFKTYIYISNSKAEEVLNTVSFSHLYDVLKEVQDEYTRVTSDVTITDKDRISGYIPNPYGKALFIYTGDVYVPSEFYYKLMSHYRCVHIELNLQGYPIKIIIDMEGYPLPSVIQKLYEIHKQGVFINEL